MKQHVKFGLTTTELTVLRFALAAYARTLSSEDLINEVSALTNKLREMSISAYNPGRKTTAIIIDND